MRNIKFRGKTKETGKWVDGSYVYAHKWFGSGKAGHFIYDIYGDERVLIDENTLGQFTGLYDKNHKEIYEGDIVCYNRKRNLPNYEVVYYVVKFDEQTACFLRYENNQEKIVVPTFNKKSFVKISGKENLSKDSMNECEVIGNIYDNPELLEEV